MLNLDPLIDREVTQDVYLRKVRNDPNHQIYDVVSLALTASRELRCCASKAPKGLIYKVLGTINPQILWDPSHPLI
jgi:hypothetical protein